MTIKKRFIMTKGTIGKNAGTLWILLEDCQKGHVSFEELKKETSLSDADLWTAIGWLARENKIEIRETQTSPIFRQGRNFYY